MHPYFLFAPGSCPKNLLPAAGAASAVEEPAAGFAVCVRCCGIHSSLYKLFTFFFDVLTPIQKIIVSGLVSCWVCHHHSCAGFSQTPWNGDCQLAFLCLGI